MSESTMNQMLEGVTTSVRSLVELVQVAAAAIAKHNDALDGLIKITNRNADKIDANADAIRELQAKVYALTQENSEIRAAIGLPKGDSED